MICSLYQFFSFFPQNAFQFGFHFAIVHFCQDKVAISKQRKKRKGKQLITALLSWNYCSLNHPLHFRFCSKTGVSFQSDSFTQLIQGPLPVNNPSKKYRNSFLCYWQYSFCFMVVHTIFKDGCCFLPFDPFSLFNALSSVSLLTILSQRLSAPLVDAERKYSSLDNP